MPLFGSSKPTTTVSTYARWFHTFNQDVTPMPDVDITQVWTKVIRDLVAKEDPRFADVDLPTFTREWIALRAEIFGLAWGHAFTGKDGHLIGEGLVAKEVLAPQGLWEIGDKYSMAVGESTQTTLPTGRRSQQGIIMFRNSMKTDIALGWVKKRGVPGDVVARVINRFFTEDAWKSGQTLRYLEVQLVQAVGFANVQTGDLNLSQDALVALQVPLLDIYQGSRETIKQNTIKAD